VIASLLPVWGADARIDRAQAKLILIAAIVVNLLVLGMLVGLPGGSAVERLLLAASAVIVFAGAVLKVGRR
jgi:hypothetical protein